MIYEAIYDEIEEIDGQSNCKQHGKYFHYFSSVCSC